MPGRYIVCPFYFDGGCPSDCTLRFFCGENPDGQLDSKRFPHCPECGSPLQIRFNGSSLEFYCPKHGRVQELEKWGEETHVPETS